jgi:hypothetical protein
MVSIDILFRGHLLPPSPPAEKATTSKKDQAAKASTDYRTRNSCVRRNDA